MAMDLHGVQGQQQLLLVYIQLFIHGGRHKYIPAFPISAVQFINHYFAFHVDDVGYWGGAPAAYMV
jgi:hypothetical protein